jgi:hypothetical protein
MSVISVTEWQFIPPAFLGEVADGASLFLASLIGSGG